MSYASEQGVLNSQWNAANLVCMAEEQRMRPFVLLRPPIFPDGPSWCVLLGENLQEGICGFGDTPDEAALAFDKAWHSERTPKAVQLAALTPKVESPPPVGEKIEKLTEALVAIGPLPLDPDWMYSAIRHCQRNMDFDVQEGFNEPDRQSGGSIALIVNELPSFLAALSPIRESQG